MGEVTVYREENQKNRVSGAATVIRFIFAALVLCLICGGLWLLKMHLYGEPRAVNGEGGEAMRSPIYVIDAGHGGMDSGAVAADGTLEKDLNLSVAKKLSALMSAAGIKHIMTRETDVMLVDDSVKEKRKMHDLKNRLAVVNEAGGETVLISIHMNKFSSPKYSGLQVWYSKNSEMSQKLASEVQSAAKTWLMPENNRAVKPATSAIYLLDRAQVPAVLIECGFLSNYEECERLKTEEYQKKLTAVLFGALVGMEEE